MSWAAVGSTVVGGLMGSMGNEESSSRRQEMDPQLRGLLYGTDPNRVGGLLGRVQQHFDANPTGMNQQQIDGMNQRWNTATDPSIRAGFQNQRQTGNALMSLPIAGNPFTREGGYSRDMFGGGGQQQPMPQLMVRQPGGGVGPAQIQGGGEFSGPPSPAPAPQPAPRQPAGQFGPAPGYNPSQQTPSDIAGLYASIGRTGENAPNAQEIAYWRNKGLTGEQLAQQFKYEAANYAGPGYDANKQMARGLLDAPRTQAFNMPAAPPAPTPRPAAPATQYNAQRPGSQFDSQEALAEYLRQQNLFNVG